MLSRITLKDVAKRAGVSRPTVARILGKDAHRFHPDTRRRVEIAAAELGYSKRVEFERFTQVDRAIVVVAPVPPESHIRDGFVGSPHFVTHGCLEAVHALMLIGIMMPSEGFSDAMIGRLIRMRPKGVLLPCFSGMGEQPTGRLEQVAEAGVPLVAYGDYPEFQRLDRVTSNHEQGSYELTRWVISKGKKRIVNLWPAPVDTCWFKQRRSGYERAMREAGIEPLPTALLPSPIVAPPGTNRCSFEARVYAGHMLELVNCRQPVDAVLLAHDGFCPAVAEGLRLLGMMPNDDVLVAGYDNAWRQFPGPEGKGLVPAATVDKRNWEMGGEMTRMLMDRIEGRLPAGPQIRFVDSELIIPGSPSNSDSCRGGISVLEPPPRGSR